MIEQIETSGAVVPVELTLAHLDSLPTLAPIAVRLLQMTLDRDGDMRELVAAIRADQAISSRLLSLANCAAQGVRQPVTTVERAVVLLGLGVVRSVVLTVKVFECFAASDPEDHPRAFDRTEFWKHSLAVACAARRLAEASRELGIRPDEAFVAGLLHDLGKIALSVVFPKAYERAAAQAAQTRGDIADFERSLLGVDHTVAGRRLAERWGLPRTYQEVIWLHHLAADALPASVASPRTIALVQLADTLVREQRLGESGNHVFYEDGQTLSRRLGVQAAAVAACLAGLVGDLAEQINILGLDRQTPDALYLACLSRANAELGRLNLELSGLNRKLAGTARYFQALALFDSLLTPTSSMAQIAAAAARSARVALQRQRVTAFVIHEDQHAVEIHTAADEAPQEPGCVPLREELRRWLAEPVRPASAPVPAPQSVRLGILSGEADAPTRDWWLLPLVQEQQAVGGLLWPADGDEALRLGAESDDLAIFLRSLSLTIGRVRERAAARRLSDELAETNRRLQQMQLELLRSRTLSMIAEMAAGAGHELNGPLTVIAGRAQMLRDELSGEAQRCLDLICEKAHECSRIVSELMDFARPRPPQFTSVEIPPLLGELREEWLRQTGFPESRLVLDPPRPSTPETPCVRADRDQIRTVLRELLSNAAEATSADHGTIRMTWRPAAPPLDTGPGFGPGDRTPRAEPRWVEIIVSDEGCGMPPQVLNRAFDPFFSHRRAGRGRGLGLARAQRIIESHGGRIWLESRQEEGTRAHVTLPPAPPAS